MNKSNSGNSIRLAVFIFIGIALFLTALYYIGDRQQLFGSTFRINGIFKDISGLQVGNNVRFSGINVGIIESIEQITDSTVIVGMLIDGDIQKFIKKNAKAIIGSEGLMGNKIMILTPGTSGNEIISNNDTIETVPAQSIDDILLKIKETSYNAASITNDLAIIFKSIREGKGSMGQFIMDSTMARNINMTLVNIRQGADGFNQNMNAAKKSFFLRGLFEDDSNDTEDD